MGKNIVILNGNPRKTGNTSELVKAFTEGAESVSNEVISFHVGGMDIHGCMGCFGGDNSRECPCVQKDDMAEIYPAVKAADVVVLASPLYYWNMSGQLRTAIDRLFALEEGNGNLLRGNGKASACLWQRRVTDLMMLCFITITLQSTCAGKILVTFFQAAIWMLAT